MQRGRPTALGRSESTRNSAAAETPSPYQGGRCEIPNMASLGAMSVYPRSLVASLSHPVFNVSLHLPHANTGSGKEHGSIHCVFDEIRAMSHPPTLWLRDQVHSFSSTLVSLHCALVICYRLLCDRLARGHGGVPCDSHIPETIYVSLFCCCSTLLLLCRVFTVLLRLCGLRGVWRAHAI